MKRVTRYVALVGMLVGLGAAPALAGPVARVAGGVCSVSAPRAPFGVFVQQSPNAYQIDSQTVCRGSRLSDQRTCPQQLAGGVWQFVPGSGGWSESGLGTCRDSLWSWSSTVGISSQFVGTPGVSYRVWVRVWVRVGGSVRSAVAVSAPYVCCSIVPGAGVPITPAVRRALR